MLISISSQHLNFALEATVSEEPFEDGESHSTGKWVWGTGALSEPQHQHVVLQLNFTASLRCYWWELLVFTRTQPGWRFFPPCLRRRCQSQAVSGGIKLATWALSLVKLSDDWLERWRSCQQWDSHGEFSAKWCTHEGRFSPPICTATWMWIIPFILQRPTKYWSLRARTVLRSSSFRRRSVASCSCSRCNQVTFPLTKSM